MRDDAYSPISTLAVVSGLMGLLASFGLFEQDAIVFSLAGIATGIPAIFRIRKYGQLGTNAAYAGISLSIAFAILAPLLHNARFHAEAPSGYERIDFSVVVNSKDHGLEEFVGKNVCLKGYPVFQNRMADRPSFNFSPDGDWHPSRKHVIVETGVDCEMNYDAMAVSGILTRASVDESAADSPKYILRSHAIRAAKTRVGLTHRIRGGC